MGFWDHAEELPIPPQPTGSPEDEEAYRSLKLRAFEEADLTPYERSIVLYLAEGHTQFEAMIKFGCSSPSAIASSLRRARSKIKRTYTRIRLIYEMQEDGHAGSRGKSDGDGSLG